MGHWTHVATLCMEWEILSYAMLVILCNDYTGHTFVYMYKLWEVYYAESLILISISHGHTHLSPDLILIPYSRKIWRGFKFGGLVVGVETAKLKSANIMLAAPAMRKI